MTGIQYKKTICFCAKQKWWVLIIAGVAWRLFWSFLVQSLDPNEYPDISKGWGIGFFCVRATIIAPLLETLIFQYLIIKTVVDISSRHLLKFQILGGLVSAFLFGLSHWYSLSYVMSAFLTGLYLSFFFIHFWRQGSLKKAYWMTVLLHFLCNLIPTCMLLLESQWPFSS